MYTCPICFDTFLFRPDPCPTCIDQANKKQRSRQAKERRARYDPSGKLATDEFWQLLRWYPHCPCCGRRWEQIEDSISQDHIIPISRGGANTVVNVQPLCQPCNLWKRDHLIAFDHHRPGHATALPQRLHPLFQQIPDYQQHQRQPAQLELLSLNSNEATSYPRCTPADLEQITVRLTWAQIESIESSDIE